MPFRSVHQRPFQGAISPPLLNAGCANPLLWISWMSSSRKSAGRITSSTQLSVLHWLGFDQLSDHLDFPCTELPGINVLDVLPLVIVPSSFLVRTEVTLSMSGQDTSAHIIAVSTAVLPYPSILSMSYAAETQTYMPSRCAGQASTRQRRSRST